MKQVDVLVVGAGPAGSSAAIAAAATGLSVLCIDKRVRCGEPVQCAEYVPAHVLTETGLAALVIQPITHMRSTVEGGDTRLSNFHGYMIHRAAFDQALLQQASDNGSMIRLDTRLTGLNIKRHIATLKCAGEQFDIAYKILIAADGPTSRVAQQLGLPQQRCASSRQISIPLTCSRKITDTWLSRSWAGGYAWLFPKGRVANLGIGLGKITQSAGLRSALQALHQQLVDQEIVLPELLSKTGGPIPIGGISSILQHGNIVFAGDAAGLAHPVTGAGIAPAVFSGRMAGEAAAEAVQQGSYIPLNEYEQEVHAVFDASWAHALKQRAHVTQQDDKSLRAGWIAFPEYYETWHGDDTGPFSRREGGPQDEVQSGSSLS